MANDLEDEIDKQHAEAIDKLRDNLGELNINKSCVHAADALFLERVAELESVLLDNESRDGIKKRVLDFREAVRIASEIREMRVK